MMKHSLLLILMLLTFKVSAQGSYQSSDVLKTNLPIVLIDVNEQLTNTEKRPAHMRVIYSEGKRQYSSDDKTYEYDGAIGIKLRGNSSLSFPQKKYTLETRDDKGEATDVSLMGMPSEHDWVLLAPYTDVSMLRDAFAFQLWNDMGHWAPRVRMCEVIVNGKYAGIYALSESIKRGEHRVNVNKLKKTDTEGRDITGGYLLRIDTYNEKDATFTSEIPGIGQGLFMNTIPWTCLYP